MSYLDLCDVLLLLKSVFFIFSSPFHLLSRGLNIFLLKKALCLSWVTPGSHSFGFGFWPMGACEGYLFAGCCSNHQVFPESTVSLLFSVSLPELETQAQAEVSPGPLAAKLHLPCLGMFAPLSRAYFLPPWVVWCFTKQEGWI